jgi:ABC-type transport system substrate-binding protein
MAGNQAARLTVSRRRVLRHAGIGAGGLAAAALLGCRQEQEPPVQQPAQAQPKRGGVLTRLTPSTGVYTVGFDPHVVSGASETGHMGFFYQTLVRYNPRTYEPEPELAQKWEQPSTSEYIFTLAPGARWQNKPPVNGRPVTADDVVFSLKRLGTNDPRFVNRSLVANLDKIEAVDKDHVRITTKTPDVTTLINLAFASAMVLAPEVVERAGKFATPDTAVGTGAFILQSMDDVSATLVRNPDYWKPGLPYLDGVKLVFISDEKAQWAAFLAGQLDIVVVPGAEVKPFLAEQAKDYTVEWFKDNSVQHLWQNTRRKPYDDARVNRALRLLMDHTEFISGWVEVSISRTFLTVSTAGTFLRRSIPRLGIRSFWNGSSQRTRRRARRCRYSVRPALRKRIR